MKKNKKLLNQLNEQKELYDGLCREFDAMKMERDEVQKKLDEKNAKINLLSPEAVKEQYELSVLQKEINNLKWQKEGCEAIYRGFRKGALEGADMLKNELKHVEEQRDVLKSKLDDIEEILHKMDNWCNAYPIDIFPEPDLEIVRNVLDFAHISLDSVSAHAMRHVVNGMSDYVQEALKKLEE